MESVEQILKTLFSNTSDEEKNVSRIFLKEAVEERDLIMSKDKFYLLEGCIEEKSIDELWTILNLRTSHAGHKLRKDEALDELVRRLSNGND